MPPTFHRHAFYRIGDDAVADVDVVAPAVVYDALAGPGVLERAFLERRRKGGDGRWLNWDNFVLEIGRSNEVAYELNEYIDQADGKRKKRLLNKPLAKYFTVLMTRNPDATICGEVGNADEVRALLCRARRRLSFDASLLAGNHGKLPEAQPCNFEGVPYRGRRWMSVASEDPGPFWLVDREVELSPETELVLTVKQELGLADKQFGTPVQFDNQTQQHAYVLFNNLIVALRRRLRTRDHEIARRRRKEHAKRQYRKCVDYVEGLCSAFRTLTIARFEFAYSTPNSLQQAKNDIARFLNNSRTNSLFKSVVGYIAKPSHWPQRGYYWDVFLIFAGSMVPLRVPFAEICDYWKGIAQHGSGIARLYGRGSGSGSLLQGSEINRDDIAGRGELLHTLAYLTKLEQYFRLKEGRTILMGSLHKHHSLLPTN